jgi:succinate dehydrogenase/fumarate reductase flavoprotein subunit
VDYDKENLVSADVLVLGGGIAGCHAAINAAKRGARVAVVEKGPTVRSGSGGAGVDHWHNAFTNPCSKITPDEVTEIRDSLGIELMGGYAAGHVRYIEARESWDALLDLEQWGVRIRDEDDEFVGADFRDEETRLLFTYDYENKHVIRVQGENVKICLYEELKRQGVEIYDRVMATSLLTKDGKRGERVVGATGVNTRTGEFYIFTAKTTVLATAEALRMWGFNTELQGLANEHNDPNNAGDGCAMAWKAGVSFSLMERTMAQPGAFCWPAYGFGNPNNTWFACTILDANGKEVPWVDRDGNVLETVEERYYPSPGQRVTLWDPTRIGMPYEVRGAGLIPDLPERIIKGEFELPLYADLPSMPEHERRVIWGLMVGHEGKTRVAIYSRYNQAGFDPDKDMLQWHEFFLEEEGPPQWRALAFVFGGGVLVDWDLRTNLEGLYAAGTQIMGAGSHTVAATTGRYAGRKAAAEARTAPEPAFSREQVDTEKDRVYASVMRKSGIGWKELHAGISRIMQDYCGKYKTDQVLKTGLRWLDSIEESEANQLYARNPHELMRSLEALSRIDVGRMIMNGEVESGELPYRFWIKAPYGPSYEANYERHSGLEENDDE